MEHPWVFVPYSLSNFLLSISLGISGFIKPDEHIINKKVGESDDDDEEPASSLNDERVDYPKCEGENAHVCSYTGEPLGVYTIASQSKTDVKDIELTSSSDNYCAGRNAVLKLHLKLLPVRLWSASASRADSER